MKKTSPIFIILITFLLLSCNTSNIKYRTGNSADCIEDSCSTAFIEKHRTDNENYDLAFVEFTDRGNIFDREKLNKVIKHIKSREKETGIMLLVYVHGWKANASNVINGDVRKFRKLLKIMSKNKLTDRKVVGVYVGWRGLTLGIEPLKTLTYWGRKNVAQQVGSGGLSEVLLRLKRITDNQERANRNIFVVSGHSFGAAVISSAMKDILISQLVNTKKVPIRQCNTVSKFKEHCHQGCYKTEPFGDGIILINPAIEANEFVQIKELSTEQKCYAREQPKLLHILSSHSDIATRVAFKPGQFLGVSLRESETQINRKILHVGDNQTKIVTLDEYELDTTTIGNYSPFRTGRSTNRKEASETEKKFCKDPSGNLGECFIPCHGDASCIESQRDKTKNFPVSPFEPLSIVYTDADFMKGHTDVFNETVTGYMASAVIGNQFKKDKRIFNARTKQCFEEPDGKPKFMFSSCLNFFRNTYRKDFCQEYGYPDCPSTTNNSK